MSCSWFLVSCISACYRDLYTHYVTFNDARLRRSLTMFYAKNFTQFGISIEKGHLALTQIYKPLDVGLKITYGSFEVFMNQRMIIHPTFEGPHSGCLLKYLAINYRRHHLSQQ